ncbi:MAG: hypothetical protein DME26_04325 [Verrucomicrobia bacterium]|nr:MAG: hypothetical protein DME26_04325 [Verrucomicrobiota bacterium]
MKAYFFSPFAGASSRETMFQWVNVHRRVIILNDDNQVLADSDEILIRNRKSPSVGKSDDERGAILMHPFANLL